MTTEQKLEYAQTFKEKGGVAFRAGKYDEAAYNYNEVLHFFLRSITGRFEGEKMGLTLLTKRKRKKPNHRSRPKN